MNLPNQLKSLNVLMIAVLLFGLMIILAATAIGCGWSGTWHSVRFNMYQSEREIGRLPPLPTMANGLTQKRAAWEAEDDRGYEDYSNSEDGSKKLDALWQSAETAEKDGNFSLDRELLKKYLQLSNAAMRRNSAIDRLDALKALQQGSNEIAVKSYVDARRLHDSKEPDSAEIERVIVAAQQDQNLQDNVAYLKAAELYRQHNYAEAADAFKSLARKYPHSEKRDAALFMNAVATMKTSASYVAYSGNADYDAGQESKTTPDEPWHDAFAAFQKVIDEYPRGRYFNHARSWQAYLLLCRGDRAGALAQYYRLLADQNEDVRIKAAVSLMLVRSEATDDEMNRVEGDLANEPQAALAYAYHNIYNYSIDPGPDEPPFPTQHSQESYEQREKEWKKKRADISHHELVRTLEFSKRLIFKYPNLSMGSAFALRVAQASEELNDNQAASQFARRALQAKLGSNEREQALWTLGIAEYRQKHFDSARKSLTQLLHDYPNTNLTEGARRNLAMIAEDAGDIDAALEQYIALKYDLDEAYFVDYLMTPEQLAGFIDKHPDSPKANEFRYALGVRYLRQNRWEDARQAFAKVRTGQDTSYDVYFSDKCLNERVDCVDVKANTLGTIADESGRNIGVSEDDNGRKQVSPQLLLRDLQTVNDLEALERAANAAVGDEAKAEALYQFASYQYQGSSLLFYNPLASPGYFFLGDFAGSGKYRVGNEAQMLLESQQEHDRLARALKIYLDIVNRFPKTRAARDALYTAAVCHERLSNYNPYWRGIYQNGGHAGDQMVTYADVRARYPNYQLPRGTSGWRPSTRTVNDGPGWAPKPPPPPRPKRLTRRERLRLIVNNVSDHVTAFWKENGKRWLTESLIVFALVLTARIARRNQRRLRARILRRRSEQAKQVVSYPWFELFWIDPELPGRRERIRQYLTSKQQEFIALARDRRTRPVLWRSLVWHSAAGTLIGSLLWTILYG